MQITGIIKLASRIAPDKRGKYFSYFSTKNKCCGYSLEAPRSKNVNTIGLNAPYVEP